MQRSPVGLFRETVEPGLASESGMVGIVPLQEKGVGEEQRLAPPPDLHRSHEGAKPQGAEPSHGLLLPLPQKELPGLPATPLPAGGVLHVPSGTDLGSPCHHRFSRSSLQKVLRQYHAHRKFRQSVEGCEQGLQGLFIKKIFSFCSHGPSSKGFRTPKSRPSNEVIITTPRSSRG